MENTIESFDYWTSKAKREKQAKAIAKDYEEALDYEPLKKELSDSAKFKELIEGKLTDKE